MFHEAVTHSAFTPTFSRTMRYNEELCARYKSNEGVKFSTTAIDCHGEWRDKLRLQHVRLYETERNSFKMRIYRR